LIYIINKSIIIEEANRFEKHLKNKDSNYQMSKRRELNNSLRRGDSSFKTRIHKDVNKFNALNLVHLVHGDKINKDPKVSKEFNKDLKLAARKSNKEVQKNIEAKMNAKTNKKNYTKNELSKKKEPNFFKPTTKDSTIYSGGDALNFKKELNGKKSLTKNNNNESGIWVHPINKELNNGIIESDFKNPKTQIGYRHLAYAGRSLNYGGVPAELKGTVPTDKLSRVENGYEAILSNKTLQDKAIAKNLQINKLPITSDMVGQMIGDAPYMADKLTEKYGYGKKVIL
jgi:hypothetical protein